VSALEERREAGWPPYSRLAMLRAEAKDSVALDAFLRAAADSRRQEREAESKCWARPAP
jgi:primosomal protein N'